MADGRLLFIDRKLLQFNKRLKNNKLHASRMLAVRLFLVFFLNTNLNP